MMSAERTRQRLTTDQWAPQQPSVSGRAVSIDGVRFPATTKPLTKDLVDQKTILVNGQLLRKPLPPQAPVAEIETWERQTMPVQTPLTLAELLNKLPRGVNFDSIKLHVDASDIRYTHRGTSETSGRIYFEVKKVTPNSFYEEELTVYHAKLAVYELELKMWMARVEEAKSRERAELEAVFSKLPPVTADPESVKNDVLTRQWLKAVKAGPASSHEDPSSIGLEEESKPFGQETSTDDGLVVKPSNE